MRVCDLLLNGDKSETVVIGTATHAAEVCDHSCWIVAAHLATVAAPAFFEWEGQGQDIFRGQVYMVANNALPQYGTHTPLFQVPLPFP